MDSPRILLQLDPDPHASSFDAVDAGVQHLLQYSRVAPQDVRDLVYGAIFTRSVKELKSTAVFIGGRDVRAGEALLEAVQKSFIGPLRVSVMLDANGANTTAAAAVLALLRHVPAPGTIAVLAGTGSVGRRVARLASSVGFRVRVASRSMERAAEVCEELRRIRTDGSNPDTAHPATPHAPESDSEWQHLLSDADAIISAGAPGATLLPQRLRQQAIQAQLLIDLNAVPPLGIDGISVSAAGEDQQGVVVYGAIGVGGIKMKLHRAAIGELFHQNTAILDADQILALGRQKIGNSTAARQSH